MTKKIVAIWAEDRQHLIGREQGLPWSLPADLRHFKETTMGQVILMGRKTFDGMGQRVLPGRLSLILTRDRDYRIGKENVLVLHSVEEVLTWFKSQDKTLYITGGSEMFSAFAPYLDELVKTEIDGYFEGDAYFPSDFDWSVFEEVSASVFPKDDKNAYNFQVKVMRRKG